MVDFGCAIMRGEKRSDMDEQMRVHAANGVHFAPGNHVHLCPEVLDAIARRSLVSRESTDVIVVPLAAQPSFALGVLLYEICLGVHPIPNYATMGHSADMFEKIDYSELRAYKAGGDEYAAIVHGLLEYHPSQRMKLQDAHRRLVALAAGPKRKRECISCEEEYGPGDGVECPSSDRPHFICNDCFQKLVQTQSQQCLADLRCSGGRIFCPFCPRKKSSVPFTEQTVARTCGEDVHAAYVDAQQRLRENSVTAENDSLIRSAVEKELLRRATMTKRQRMIDDARKHIENDLLADKCFNCGAVWYDFRNCAAVKCGNCPNYFCACCCEDFGPGSVGGIAAHDHVPKCAFNPRPGKLFAPPDEIRVGRPKLWQLKVDSFLAGLGNDIRLDVIEVCRAVLEDAGVKVPAEVASSDRGAGKSLLTVGDGTSKKARGMDIVREDVTEHEEDSDDLHEHDEARPPSPGTLDAIAVVEAHIAAEEEKQRQDAIARVEQNHASKRGTSATHNLHHKTAAPTSSEKVKFVVTGRPCSASKPRLGESPAARRAMPNIVSLGPKQLNKLIKALRGSFFGLFGGNPLSLMRELNLSPDSMPFGDGSTTILQYARQRNLKSVKHLEAEGVCENSHSLQSVVLCNVFTVCGYSCAVRNQALQMKHQAGRTTKFQSRDEAFPIRVYLSPLIHILALLVRGSPSFNSLHLFSSLKMGEAQGF